RAGEIAMPASRPASLVGKRLLLLDNGKLSPDYGPYAVIQPWLVDRFDDSKVAVATIDLLRHVEGQAASIAADLLSKHRPDAVVLALSDAGVTMMTALVATELERLGVPTAILATPLGAGLAEVILEARLPGLTPLVIRTVRTDSREAVRELLDGSADEL